MSLFKKLACVFVFILVVAGLTATVAWADTSDKGATLTSVDPVKDLDSESTYASIAAAISDGKTNLQLIGNLAENVSIASGKTIILDLNGCVLKAKNTGSSVISNEGTLTIKDTKHSDTTVKHYFTVDSKGVWKWNNDNSVTDYCVIGGVITGGKSTTGGAYGNGVANKGTLEIDSVNIIGNYTGNWGGGLLSEDGSLTVQNSLIAHNYSVWCAGVGIRDSGTYSFENTEISNNKSQYEGGGFYIENAVATLTNCTIDGNSTTDGGAHGGGLYLKNYASVTMNGGSVSNNSAAASNGAAYLTGSACSLTLNGVSVTGNTAKSSAGGIAITDPHTLSVSGATKISGNTYGTTPVISNVYLASGKAINVSAALTSGASIGVTLESSTGAVTSTTDAANAKYFTSDNASYTAVFDIKNDSPTKNKVKLVEVGTNTAVIVETGAMKASVQAAETEATNNQTIRMLANSTENIVFSSTKTITLDLNGKVLCGTGTDSVIKVNKTGSKLTITDSNPSVEHKFIPAAGDRKAGLWTWNETSGTQIVKGGIITGGSAGNGGGVYLDADTSGELVLEGGSIVGCKATSIGGGVYANSPFTMTGGAIIGCEKNGVALLSKSSFNMTGGTISNCNGGGEGGGILVGRNITISMSGNAKITECEATSGGGLRIGSSSYPSAVFTMSGNASISKCSASASTSDSYGGGGVWIRGTIIMKDNASISECEASTGGGILLKSGTFNMKGGSISQCKIVKNSSSYHGGGVFVSEDSSQFNMSGGIIEKCEAIVNLSSTSGGGVYVKSGGFFTMTDGEISQCKTKNNGGGVYNNGTMTVGGKAKITGNTKSDGTAANNLYLPYGKTVNVGTGDDAPKSSMSIGVTLGGDGIGAVTGANSADYHEYFVPDDSNLASYNDKTNDTNQVVKLAKAVAQIKSGEHTTKYATVQAAIDAATLGQTVQMIADSTENVTVGSSTNRTKNVTLDLNGKTLSSTGTVENIKHSAITNHATLTIADSSSSKTGKITGGTGAAIGIRTIGGGIYNTGGTLTITGGTITGNTATLGGGVANVDNGEAKGTFNMSGGTISGNTSPSTTDNTGGGGVYNDAIFNMSGGTISGNNAAKAGGGVFNKGTMSVSGTANISGNKNGTEATAAASNVYLPSGKTINVSAALTSGASIGVTLGTTDGTGAVTGANSADYHEYFVPDNSKLVSYNDKTNETNQVVKLKHAHIWTYTLSTTTSTNDTITASCSGYGTCDYAGTDKTLTIAASGATYDGNSHGASFTQASFLGKTGSDLPTISYEYKATSGGTYATVTDAKAAGYYKASFTVGEGDGAKTGYVEYTISQKTLTVTPKSNQSKTYDGTTAMGITYDYTGNITGETPAFTGALALENAAVAAGTHKIVAGTLALKDNSDFKANNYSLSFSTTPVNFTINTKQLSISNTTVADKAYDGTTAASATAGTLGGVVENDKVTVSIDSATFADINVGNGKAVTVTYSISGEDADNYLAPETDTSLTANITAATLTLTPKSNQSKTYDGTTATGITYDYTGNITGETPAFTGALALENTAIAAGTHKIVAGTLALEDNDAFKANNYSLSFSTTPVNFTINTKSIEDVIVEGIEETYDYTGKAIKPAPTKITIDGIVLSKNDYTVSYLSEGDYTEPGAYEIKIEGKGNFEGAVTKTFTIAEPSPVEPEPVPSTGDEAGVLVVLSMLTMLCAAVTAFVVRKRRYE